MVNMKIFEFLKDYQIPYTTTGKNVSGGWVNIQCPMCNDPSMHMGYNYSDDYGFYCFRCGHHFADETIQKLIGVNRQTAKQIIRKYEGKTKTTHKNKNQKKPFELPTSTEKLQKIHRKYLLKRGFDPDELEYHWKIMGTGPVSTLDGIDYSKRLLIPIYWNEGMVSFQTRDVTDKSDAKYKACPEHREIIHHKDILYGMPLTEWETTGFIVEGVTDCWKMGWDSAATFGIKFTSQQLREIARTFNKAIIVFDPDEHAQKQAKKLMSELKFRGVTCFNYNFETDPGEADEKEILELFNKFKIFKL